MGKILVVGSLNMDFVVQVDHMPIVGETILSNDFQLVPGGKGANQAYTCAHLGAQTRMLGAVGQDSYGEALLRNLQTAGVETGALLQCSEESTGMAIISVNRDGDNSIVVVPGANNRTTPDYLKQHEYLIQQTDAVIMQMEIPLDSIIYMAKTAKKMNKTVILDPAPAVALHHELLQHVDIIKPNESELHILTNMPVNNHEQIVQAAHFLLNQGVGAVVVTMGGDGALLCTATGYKHFAGRKVAVVDTTAAGDSFTAAMAQLITDGYSIEQAISFAIDVSALVVTRKGAQSSIPSREEIAQIRDKG